MLSAFLQIKELTPRQWRLVDISLTLIGMTAISLVKFGLELENNFSDTTYYLCMGVLALIGLMQLLWSPSTVMKRRFYIVVYHLVGILICAFVVGFNTLFMVGWLVLITFSGLAFGWRGTMISVGALLLSVILWWQSNLVTFPEFLVAFFEATIVSGLALGMMQVIEISRRRGEELAESQAQERLEHDRLVALVNSMGDGVIAISDQGVIRIYNAAAASILDTNVNLVGKTISKVLRLRDSSGNKVRLLSILKELHSNIVRTDLLHEFNDGEKIHLYLNISPIHLGYQHIGEHGYILLLRDITKEKSLEQERDEFISVVSHELRTPIAIAEGNISNVIVLEERGANKKMLKQSVQDAYQQITFLSKMVNDLATLSRAERGTADMEVEEINLAELLEQLHDSYQEQAAKKGLKLVTQTKGQLAPFRTSRLYLQEILQNFITNAIKYTKEGTVTVTAELDGRKAVFTIKDTGIGISKSDQKRLFQKFFRSEDYRTRESSGTGLGLYLVKKLTQQLHGKIVFGSRLNHGSTFTVTIPPLKKEPAQE